LPASALFIAKLLQLVTPLEKAEESPRLSVSVAVISVVDVAAEVATLITE
jgi:hypothetical protein